MNDDAAQPSADGSSFDLDRLPDIEDIEIRRRRFEPPHRVTHSGIDTFESDGIEITIRVSEPFVIRSLGPVLWVGDEPLTVGASTRRHEYGFYAYQPQRLEGGAPISLSWGTEPTRRHNTKFIYRPPDDE